MNWEIKIVWGCAKRIRLILLIQKELFKKAKLMLLVQEVFPKLKNITKSCMRNGNRVWIRVRLRLSLMMLPSNSCKIAWDI